MIHILFIVPYPELREKVEYVLDNHPENKRISANIQVLTVDQISRINAGSYDAVIARGFSAVIFPVRRYVPEDEMMTLDPSAAAPAPSMTTVVPYPVINVSFPLP